MKPLQTDSAQVLRRRAEIMIGADDVCPEQVERAVTREAMSSAETKRLLHELQVHQVELEMQNDELRQTQHELEASRERYFELFNMAPVGYLTLDMLGNILEVNLAVATMLGVTRSALVNSPLSRFIFSEDRHTLCLQRKQPEESDAPQQWEVRMIRADGSIVWVELNATPMWNNECWVAINDITCQKRANELSKHAEQYQAMIAANLFGFLLVDATGRLLDVNDTYCWMSGYSREELLQLSVPDIEAVESSEEFARHRQQLIELGADHFESRHRAKDGRIFDVEISTSYLHSQGKIIVFIRDISERTQIKKALVDSEARYRAVVEDQTDLICRYRPDGRLSFVNEAYVHSCGKKHNELLNHNFIPHIPEPDLSRILELLKGITPDSPIVTVEHRVLMPDGTVRWEHWIHRGIYSAEQELIEFQAVGRDISLLKHTEDVQAFLARTSSGVTNNEPFFNELARYLAQSLDMYFICIDRLEGDGLTATTVAVWCDGHFEDNVSYALKDTPCGDVVGKEICCFPASVCKFFPRDNVLHDLNAESYVGVTLWSHTGQPIGLIAVIGQKPLKNRQQVETTLKMVAVRSAGELERLDVEEALKRSESELVTAQAISHVGSWRVVYDEGGEHWYGSDEFYRIYGYPLTSQINMLTGIDRMHPDDREYVKTAWSAAMVGAGSDVWEHRIVVDGQTRWLNVRVNFLYNNDRSLREARGVVQDITERKQLENELHKALDDANNTNVTMLRLLQTIGHEFRTPLGLLIGSTDILDRYWDRLTPKTRFEQNERIRSSARQISNLVNSVVSFNQLGTDRSGNHPRLLDIGTLCRAIAAEVETVWSAGHKFNVTIAAKSGTAELDEVLLRRVLENLLTNAYRYTPPDGAVSLHVYREDNRLCLEISDTGIGIPEEDQNQIFDPFYRSRNVDGRRGLGLGLSIVNDALLQLGGTISVVSRIGEGTSMRVEIPVD